MKKTNAARLLDKLKIAYEIKEYPVDETDLSAANVAQKVGLPPRQVFKTLVARGDKTGVIMGIVSGEAEIDLKALASASGNKKVEMVHLNEVLPLTGYIRGGVSPLGAKKNYPVYLDRSALTQSIISISAGLRGMQIFLRPDDLVKATGAGVCDIGRVVGEIGEGNE
jgi:Cys-tRNA(Pro)/Cys-tRNA(Cys) deacylase